MTRARRRAKSDRPRHRLRPAAADRRIPVVREQLLSRPATIAFLAAIISEVRSRAWLTLAAITAIGGAVVLSAPIPFWNPEISGRAVLSLNIAVIVVTIAVASSSDTLEWLSILPVSAARAALIESAARISVGSAAIAAACLSQAVVQMVVTENKDFGSFLRQDLAASILAVVTLAPWSGLGRALTGRLAAPWFVVAVAMLGGAAVGESRVLEAIRVFLPALPLASPLATGPTPRDWAYGVTHAAALTVLTSLLARRYR